jgi:starch-binding outer membrane protein, SusD/RagB family
MLMKNLSPRAGLRPLPWLAMFGALAVAGCDSDRIVAVADPARLTPDAIDAASTTGLVNGALRQFVGGYSGFGDDSFVAASGLITDELYFGDTFTTRFAVDSRNLQAPVLGNIMDASYSRLHQARLNSRRAAAALAEFQPQNTAGRARMRAIEAYTYVTFSEGWCSAVPFSRVPDTGAIDPREIVDGAPLSTTQMGDTAVARFNEALQLNPGDNLARVGLGRALLNLGRYADAAAAVQAVPTTFVHHLEHSSNAGSQNNPLFSLMSNGRYGVSNDEGGTLASGAAKRPDLPATSADFQVNNGEGVPFRALMDPRVPWEGRRGPGQPVGCFTGSINCWRNNNVPNNDANIPLASGIEARLIEAEAALQAGRDEWLTILNSLRANAAAHTARLHPQQLQTFSATLAPLAMPGTAQAKRDLLFQERALWLFNTGHRQGDLRRLIRNYGLPQNQVFPSGPYFRGGNYGNDVAFPVPFNEQANPLFNPASCVTTQA